MSHSDTKEAKQEKKQEEKKGYQFGAFKGVFTPNILTILGVIMYLRFGWVLGHVGLWKTLLIVTMSTFITFMTSISISQLATNAKVGGGGAYFIISRSLGIEAGAAIGLPLYLAQALSIAFYVAGFSESLVGLYPDLSMQWVGIITLVILTIIAYISADLTLKVQFLIMALIAASLVSFFMGNTESVIFTEATPLVLDREKFWVVFSVFFPAVTGILAGLSMSGELKSPQKALPQGTIGAVLVSYVVYMAIPVFLSILKIDPRILVTNSLIMRDVAKWGNLVMLGLWGAALSSVLGSLLGAPRTLQAMAQDGIIPKFIGSTYGKNKDPRIAILISFFLGLAGVLMGNFNAIASILAMFFLTTYGLLNFSAWLEGMIQNPSWRPSFKSHWIFPFLGGAGCMMVMLMINAGATIIATLLTFGIYFLMQRRKMNAYWGDMKYAILMLLTRFAIYRLVKERPHEKSWRPNILLLSGSPASRWYLVALADAFSHGKGFLTVSTILKNEALTKDRIEKIEHTIHDYLKERFIPAIVKVHIVDKEVLEGAKDLVQAYGFGPLEPNTVLLGRTEEAENYKPYAELVKTIFQHRKNLVIVKETETRPDFSKTPRIDVWWRREGQNAGLMLALAFLVKTSPEWKGARLVLKTLVAGENEKEQVAEHLQTFISSANIEAEAQVVVGNTSFPEEAIRENSRDASLIFLGLRAPGKEETAEQYSGYYQSYIKKTNGFPATAMVLASDEIDFHAIFKLHEG